MNRMRSHATVIAISAALTALPRVSLAAPDEYDDSQANPLRVMAYGLYPAGFMAEWLVFRPFHWLVGAAKPQEGFFGPPPHPPIFTRPEAGYCFWRAPPGLHRPV